MAAGDRSQVRQPVTPAAGPLGALPDTIGLSTGVPPCDPEKSGMSKSNAPPLETRDR